LTLRQDKSRLTGKTLRFSREDERLQHHTAPQMTRQEIVRQHESLKKPCKIHIRGKIRRKYQKRTSMISAGITEHIWTLKELLTYPFIKT